MSVRPITDTLRLLDGGAFIDRCSDELAALVKAVEATGKTDRVHEAAAKDLISLVRSGLANVPLFMGGCR